MGARLVQFLIASAVALVCGCSNKAAPEAYRPGLGEIMTLTQMRHAKLWLAGQAGNWPLAEYETHELEEGFDDVVTFHPKHRGSQVPLAQAVPIMTNGPLAAVRAAIRNQDRAEFTKAYDSLTAACNECHRKTSFKFNVVTRPTGNPYLNQDFAPPG